jgi:hypothetical protein
MSHSNPAGDPNPYAPSPVAEWPQPEMPATLTPQATAAIKTLFDRGRSGAAWFYWVAALSLVNSIAALADAEFGFALGLGVTMIADGVAAHFVENGAPPYVRAIVFGFDLVILAMVVGCGWLSQKRVLPIYAIGMVMYLFDGLLYVPGFNIISIAIHGFALWCMWAGFQAYRQLGKLEQSLAQPFVTF